MTPERMRQLETNMLAFLRPEEAEDGYHFCADWDFMLIHRTDPEFKIECHCRAMAKWRETDDRDENA